MSRIVAALTMLALVTSGSASAQSDNAQPGQTVVESETAPKKVVRPESLGTCAYEPRPNEAAHFQALAADERVTGSILRGYSIGGRTGQTVSWFGIVRSVAKPDPAKDEYELLVEHKYFDGLTDLHILALSFNGGGDFKVRIRAKDPPLPTLALVRVYGKVAEEKEGVPVLDAAYVRVWPWLTFAFIGDYGDDAGNSEWRKLCKVPLGDIYDSSPDDAYYRDRLGEPPTDGK